MRVRGGGADLVGGTRALSSPAFCEQGAVDAVKDGGEVSAGAAAGVEDVDVRAGEAEGLVELGAEEVVDALDHVGDDLSGGVPDAEVLAELGVEGFEERLVEVLDCVGLAEVGEEGGSGRG